MTEEELINRIAQLEAELAAKLAKPGCTDCVKRTYRIKIRTANRRLQYLRKLAERDRRLAAREESGSPGV